MIFGIFVLVVAILISAVSAFYSVSGLTAIFAAAFWPVVIMGGALELGKITATVWLHAHWKEANWQFKAYLVPAIVILMFITSMGTYGFLAKAHSDQGVPLGDVTAKVDIIDAKIATAQDAIQVQKDNITSAKASLAQLDSQVNELLGRTADAKGATRAYNTRKAQARDRKAIQAEIVVAQKEIETITASIAKLREERAPIASEVRKVEAEVGPIKYIAALIYGDNPDANLLERAVRYVIILIVFVFDPLALVLILAGEQTIVWARERKRQGVSASDSDELTQLKSDMAKLQQDRDRLFAAHSHEMTRADTLAQQIPDIEEPKNDILDAADSALEWVRNASNEELEQAVTEVTKDVEATGKIIDDTVIVPTQEEFFERGKVLAKELDTVYNDREPGDPDPINPTFRPAIIADNVYQDARAAQSGFGTEFPDGPVKGDTFLRVDYLPSRLFKWNDYKWIEVNKETLGSYAYDREYIKHLVEKISKGEYDVEMLSQAEQDQIEGYLNDQSTK